MSTTIRYDRFRKIEQLRPFKHILKIHVPAGTPAIFIDPIDTEYIGHRDEQELLFPPGQILGLIDYPFSKDGCTIYKCVLLNLKS